eukprot:3110870-Pyramimonas_sp.AAC.1
MPFSVPPPQYEVRAASFQRRPCSDWVNLSIKSRAWSKARNSADSTHRPPSVAPSSHGGIHVAAREISHPAMTR